MFKVQLRPVSQQQNSTIFKPVATAISPIPSTQATSIQVQGFVPNYQAASSYQFPATQPTSVTQSLQIPSTQLNTAPWAQFQAVKTQPWQAYQPTATYSNLVQPGQMLMQQQPSLVQGIAHNIVQPLVDIAETNSEVVLSYDLPLVDQNNLNLSVSLDSVTLQANSGQGIFYRTVSLPTDVFPESAEATLTNEILEVRIPKTSQARRKVNINQQEVQQTQQQV